MAKKREDANQAAKRIMENTTGGPMSAPGHEKNPAAVELGRRGGLKGGKARAAKLSAARRKEIAQHAAQARWANYQQPNV